MGQKDKHQTGLHCSVASPHGSSSGRQSPPATRSHSRAGAEVQGSCQMQARQAAGHGRSPSAWLCLAVDGGPQTLPGCWQQVPSQCHGPAGPTSPPLPQDDYDGGEAGEPAAAGSGREARGDRPSGQRSLRAAHGMVARTEAAPGGHGCARRPPAKGGYLADLLGRQGREVPCPDELPPGGRAGYWWAPWVPLERPRRTTDCGAGPRVHP
mmetsp:Transcript_10291/g.29366  ORF Transcript_10291/g.29366 Transcript_10291/m.29366 type:complete len:210 (+) Transcript_10291:498-1127(+)